MKKRLNLKPSARDKRRYFIISENDKKVKDAILKYIGVLGLAKSAYMSVKVPELKGKNIGSCLRKELDNVRAGLTLARIRIEKVSNTIKGLSE
jgi:RNase P/RNase MRP subunit POP5